MQVVKDGKPIKSKSLSNRGAQARHFLGGIPRGIIYIYIKYTRRTRARQVAKVSKSKEYGIQRQGLPIGDAAKPHIFSAVLWVRLLVQRSLHLFSDLATSSQLFSRLLTSCQLFSTTVLSVHLFAANFYTEELLNRASFYTEQAFTQSSFYTEKLLQTKSFYTEKALTQRSFYTEKLLTQTEELLHRARFYTDNLLHKGAFTQRSFYAEAFTWRSFYTEKLLHKEAFTQRSFYTKPAFTQWNFNLHGNRNYSQNRASAPKRKNDDFWSAFYNKGIW